MAGQANTNGKSKVFLDTTPVTVDDEDFDQWVGTRLDIAFRPCPSTSAGPGAGITGNQPAMDFLALSQMLSTTIGTNMMQFSQAVTPTVGAAGAMGGDTTLATGKGFDQDKLRSSRVHVVSAMPSKSLSSRPHCKVTRAVVPVTPYRPRQIYIPRSEDLLALRFNPGGPVAQFHSVAWGMSMLACRLLTAVAA